jgi:soluble lytic murein transglycosylase-like protein
VILLTIRDRPAIPLFNRSQHHSSVPTKFMTAIERSGGLGRPLRSMACLRPIGVALCFLGILLTTALPHGAMAASELATLAALSKNSSRVVSYAAFVTEASRRFAVPEHWIRAVMQFESGGNARAVSSRGALGLMQIMPQTWVEMSARFELGIDPFDPRDNILAGTAFLHEMLDRFGSEGFLAAYNAGPQRYEEHLATGGPLPKETQAYVARLAPLIGVERRKRGTSAARGVVFRQQAALFIEQSGAFSANSQSASTAHWMHSSRIPSAANTSALVPRATGLFMQRSNEVQSQ